MKNSRLDRNITQLLRTNSKKWTVLEKKVAIYTGTEVPKLKFNQNTVNILLLSYTYGGIINTNENG